MSRIGKNGDAVFLPVLGDFEDFFKGTKSAAAKAGQEGGKAFADSLQREVSKAEKAFDSATRAQERAQNRATTAAEKTRVAQLKLAETMEKTNVAASQLAKAESDYARAQRDEVLATKAAERANENAAKAKRDLKRKTDEASGALHLGADAVADFGRAARNARGDVDGLSESSGGLGRKVADGLKTVGRGALLGAGAKISSAVMDGVHAGISGGFKRLESVEVAETMLAGLGHSGEAIQGIMDNAMASVKGTAFGFGEAASMASTFVAAGVEQGEDLERVLKLVGDSAAITGSDFKEMGAIWSKVAGNQKLTTQELNQMLDRSLGLLPKLQEKYGVTADEARKMVTEGKVSFQEFSDVMEDMVGGAAAKMGDTFSGSKANMFAAFSRAGEMLMEPFFDVAPQVFQSVGESVDGVSKQLQPLIEQIAVWLEPRLQFLATDVIPALGDAVVRAVDGLIVFGKWVQDHAGPISVVAAGIGGVAVSMSAVATAQKIMAAGSVLKWVQSMAAKTKVWAKAQALLNAVMNANPIVKIASIAIGAAAAFGVFFAQTETGRELLAKLGEVARGVWESVSTWFSGVAEAAGGLTDRIGEIVGVVTEHVAGIAGVVAGVAQDVWGMISERVSGVVDFLRTAWEQITGLFSSIGESDFPLMGILSTIGEAVLSMLEPVRGVFGSLLEVLGSVVGVLGNVAGALAGVVGSAFSAFVGIVKSGINAVLSFGGAIGEIFTAISPVLIPALKTLGAILGGTLFVGLKIVTAALKVAGGIIQGFAKLITWTLDYAISPLISGLGALTSFLVGAFGKVIEGVIFLFGKMGEVAAWVAGIITTVVVAPMAAAWQFLSSVFEVGFRETIQPVLDGFRAGAEWLGAGLQKTVLGIASGFSWLGEKLGEMKAFVVDKVFGGMKAGADDLSTKFEVAVAAIRLIMDGLREAAAAPVRFVVETVWNNGLLKAINAVTSFIGMDKVEPVQIGFAAGGVMPGGQGTLPGYTPGHDVYNFVEPSTGLRVALSGGEPILRPEAGRVLGRGWVDGINAAARTGGTRGVERFLGGFASGGVIGSITDVVQRNFPMMTITSTYRPGDPGHHGTGNAVDFSNGTDSTPQMRTAAQFFYKSYGPGLFEIIHSPFNNNVKNGKNVGDGFGFYGAGIMGQHRNHVHVASPAPLGDPKVMVEMLEDGGGSGSLVNVRAKVAGIMKKIMDPILNSIPEFEGGFMGRLPKAIAQWAFDNVMEFVSGKANIEAPAGGQAGSAESWREMAMAAMRRQGFNADDPAQVNAMLSQIMSESGGNPGIAQQIVDINGTGESAGVGLLQIIPGTFAAHRDPELPDDRRDPWANMNAALRYYRSRYGGDLTTMWGHGHGYARGGILPGYTPGRDVYNFVEPSSGMVIGLSGGEPILRPEAGRVLGNDWVDGVNAAARVGGVRGVAKFLGGYASGGVLGGGASRAELPVALPGSVAELEAVLRRTLEPIARSLEKIADPSTYEGIAARAGAEKFGAFAGLLGLETVSGTIGALISAERELLEEREAHASRVQKIADQEKSIREMRKELADLEKGETELSVKDKRKLADAEEAVAKARKKAGVASAEAAEAESDASEKSAKSKKSAASKAEKSNEQVEKAEKKLARVREDLGIKAEEDEEKRSEKIEKLREDLAKAEDDLAASRRESARGLDIPLYDVLPQIADGLNHAATEVTKATPKIVATVAGQLPQAVGVVSTVLPQVSGALSSMAAAAGPAGVSIGVAVAALFSVVKVGKWIVETVDKFKTRVIESRKAVASALGSYASAMREITEAVAKQREQVTRFRMDLVRASIAQTRAAMDSRNANAAVVQARLEGDKAVATAQAALLAGVREELGRAARAGEDLAEKYERYRWGAVRGARDMLNQQRVITPEILALSAEVDAAELDRLATTQEAMVNAIESAYAYREAQRATARAVEDLTSAVKELDEFAGIAKQFGMDRKGARVGEELASLMGELAEVQGRLWSWSGRLSISYNRHGRAVDEAAEHRIKNRIAEIKAMPEFKGFGVADTELDSLVHGAANMYKWGKGEQAQAMLANSVLGDPARFKRAMDLSRDLAEIDKEDKELGREVEDLEDEVSKSEAVKPYEAQAASAKSAAEAARARAAALREKDEKTAESMRRIADFYQKNAADIVRTSRGQKTQIDLTYAKKTAYSAEEYEALINAFGNVDNIELRVKRLEEAQRPSQLELLRGRK